MYAVIEDSGAQFKVSEGDVIKVDHRNLSDDQGTLTFDRVLLVGAAEGAGDPKIGDPYVEGASVTAEVMAKGRTRSVPVVKFKRRKTYLRRNTHRQDFIQVRIKSIQA